MIPPIFSFNIGILLPRKHKLWNIKYHNPLKNVQVIRSLAFKNVINMSRKSVNNITVPKIIFYVSLLYSGDFMTAKS
jgi:hypothetical protein